MTSCGRGGSAVSRVSRGTFRFEPCAPELPLSVLTGHMSCDVLILVEESTDAVASVDLANSGWRAAGEWS